MNVYDSFETPKLAPIWEQTRLVSESLRMQANVTRTGKQAVAITILPGYLFEKGQHGDSDSERSELLEARSLVARQDRAYEYSFSMYFPGDFPIVPTRLVVAQWKQYCPTEIIACSDQSPVLAIRYINGELIVTQDIDGHYAPLFKHKGEFRGRWLDFRVQTRFSPTATGHICIWMNAEQIVNYRGKTADTEGGTSGYPVDGHFYFKMGLYRNVMRQPMTIYIDDYHKRSIHVADF